MCNKNMVCIKLKLTEQGLKKFQGIPTFQSLLYDNQLKRLSIGVNSLRVNQAVWSKMQVLCTGADMKVEKDLD